MGEIYEAGKLILMTCNLFMCLFQFPFARVFLKSSNFTIGTKLFLILFVIERKRCLQFQNLFQEAKQKIIKYVIFFFL